MKRLSLAKLFILSLTLGVLVLVVGTQIAIAQESQVVPAIEVINLKTGEVVNLPNLARDNIFVMGIW